MKNSRHTVRIICVMLVGLLCLGMAAPLWGQFGDALKIAERLRKEKQERERKEKKEQAQQADSGNTAGKPAAAPAGTIVFSASPIDPTKPENLATEFKAGDSLYALIQIDKTWRDLLGKGRENLSKIEVPIDMIVDGKDVDFQYVTIKKTEAMDSKVLVLDIAPDPAKMTAYKDEGFAYGEGKGRRKIGPDQYTYILGRLSPGKHTVKLQIRSYGDVFSVGEFTIAGDDYKPYAVLREKILQEMLNVGGMPKAQKTDTALETQMMKLLLNAGWKNIRRLVIVDKDWWYNRQSGGESPIVSRHIAAAVAAKDADGSFFWSNVTFQQHRLIDGSYGALEISRTGDKRPIKEQNINK